MVYAHRISLPAIPGYEGVGIVEAVGAEVSSDYVGHRVLPLRGEGTWQPYVRVPSAWAVLVPDTIEDYAAAQLYINPLTAWITCTDILRLRSEDVLLVNACGSAIGCMYAQLFHLRHWNERVSTDQWQAAFDRLMDWIGERKIVLRKPERVFVLLDVRQAVQYTQSKNKGIGKTFLCS